MTGHTANEARSIDGYSMRAPTMENHDGMELWQARCVHLTDSDSSFLISGSGALGCSTASDAILIQWYSALGLTLPLKMV